MPQALVPGLNVRLLGVVLELGWGRRPCMHSLEMGEGGEGARVCACSIGGIAGAAAMQAGMASPDLCVSRDLACPGFAFHFSFFRYKVRCFSGGGTSLVFSPPSPVPTTS